MINVGINGFGRIGRQVFKIISEKYGDRLKVAAVNDIADTKTLVHLLKYDSTYGRTEGVEAVLDNSFSYRGYETAVLNGSCPELIPWEKYDVDIVIEATSLFKNHEAAIGHLERGAKKVIISAMSKDADKTLVLGVNESEYDPDGHDVISNASCTTNALVPVMKVMDEAYGIKRGMVTTVHSYTGDQRLLDLPHRDPRRSRAAGLNIIPTTTGAGKAVAMVLPSLKGKLSCMSVRVPTPTVSMLDISVELNKEVETEEINSLFKEMADKNLKGIMGYTDEELVSSDFKGLGYSTVIDGASTEVLDGNFVKIVSWYDNEWGYSARLADVTALIARRLK